MKAGQKFVCIVHSTAWKYIPNYGPETDVRPVKGEIYTLLVAKNDPEVTSGISLSFVELGADEWFDSTGFRPVDENFGKKVTDELEKEFVPLEIGEQVSAILKICGVAEAKSIFESISKKR